MEAIHKINENNISKVSWDDQWWSDFLDQTANFKNSIAIADVMDDETVLVFNEITLDILREIFKRQNTAYDFRLYLDRKSKDRKYMVKNLFGFPPHEKETPADWATRVFGDQKFGMIINSGEKFSNRLAEKLAVYLNPLLEQAGLPLKGINITIFAGNYGFTPLGIHTDHPGENVMHLHLGPGDKTMYNWEIDAYRELAGDIRNNENILPLLPYAKSFHFKKGDIYFMPWDKFHIGNTEEFSIGISVWYNNMPLNKLLVSLLRSLKFQYTKEVNIKDKSLIVPPYKSLDPSEGFDKVMSAMNMDEEQLNLSLKDISKELYEEYILSLYSNQGWKTRPIAVNQELGKDDEILEETTFHHLKDKIVHVPASFKMTYKIIKDVQLRIFARGTKIEVKYHPELIRIIEKLNSGSQFKTEELLKELNLDWPEDAGLYILNLLYLKRAVVY